MRKISLKTVIHVFFCAIAVIGLSVCVVEPISYTDFAEDQTVTDIVAGKVNLTGDSEGTAGNGVITVDTASYYTVEEFKEFGDSTPISAQFVSKSGSRTKNTNEIARVSGGKITGLTNGNWYRVLKATPLKGSVVYENVTTTTTPTSITGTTKQLLEEDKGKITLPAPATGDTYYMDVSALKTGDQAPAASYDIVRVPVSPTGTSSLITGNIIKLDGEGTQTDYVFAEKLANGDAYVTKFFFFTVVIEPKLPDPEIIISITFNYSSANTKTITLELTNSGTTITGNTYTINQSTPPTITIALNAATISSLSDNPTYNWYYDKDNSFTAIDPSINVDFGSNPNYLLLGTNTFTVIIGDNDGFYTAEVMITTVGGS